MVQFKDQRNGRRKCVFPDVRIAESARAGEGSHRGFLPRSRLGYASVRLLEPDITML